MHGSRKSMMIAQHVEETGKNQEYRPTPEDPRESFNSLENTAFLMVCPTPSQVAEFVLKRQVSSRAQIKGGRGEDTYRDYTSTNEGHDE